MRYFLKKAPGTKFLGSDGAYIEFEKVGPPLNVVGLAAIDEASNPVHVADLDKAVKNGNVGTWVSITEAEYQDIKKKLTNLVPERQPSPTFGPGAAMRVFNPNRSPFAAHVAEAAPAKDPTPPQVPAADLPQGRRPRVGRPRPSQ